jgi:hypothetical protein
MADMTMGNARSKVVIGNKGAVVSTSNPREGYDKVMVFYQFR